MSPASCSSHDQIDTRTISVWGGRWRVTLSKGPGMKIILPDRDTAIRHGWKFQVQWIENRNPCFIRCTSGREADARAAKLRKAGAAPVVVDLVDALQI